MRQCDKCGTGWENIMNLPNRYVCSKCGNEVSKPKQEQVPVFKKEEYLNEAPLHNYDKKWLND
jgi:DNA-directed RNA polymerase subunit RPC12/RpoP